MRLEEFKPQNFAITAWASATLGVWWGRSCCSRNSGPLQDPGCSSTVVFGRISAQPLGLRTRWRISRLSASFTSQLPVPLGARVALAAEQLGGAERCLDMAVEYAKQRHQFGRAIGSFQAIKHKCADMLLQVECARSAVYYAAWVATHQPGELRTAAALAKIACSEAYFHCAGENIQIHGGIGFTWEHDAHLHFKRARAARAWLGTPGKLRERLAEAMGI